ncbi:hypothetical protein Dsin_018661 [Dipteronia sinensis]|uniref:DUF4371 domain-containing protein n=1 Tax=Dipteronia sinensis TaxID=43782 RepID=A0AAE0A5Q4_9ROSI|nr:hypothetical protein Dsin_018661 [Dipteronia sinensis]
MYDVIQQDEVRRAYNDMGPCQPELDESRRSGMEINFVVFNMRGQDGVSNMGGAWNGLQSIFLNDCPYAYYIHCFAHRLQLALVVVCCLKRYA